MASSFYLGHRLSWQGALCTVRYIGTVGKTRGEWLGVEWDDPTRGKHSGDHEGQWYFYCLSKSLTAASFIRPDRQFDQPLSFLEALHKKYASDTEVGPTADGGQLVTDEPIKISGKVVEEVGFEKIKQQLAAFHDLRVVLLDGLCVAGLGNTSFPWFGALEEGLREQHQNEYLASWDKVKETCPNIIELDLSRNLLEAWADVAVICRGLQKLEILKVNGNRFRDLFVDFTDSEGLRDEAFPGLKQLFLDGTYLSWDEIVFLTLPLPSLTELSVQYSSLSTIPQPLQTPTLTTLGLAYNEFTSFSALRPLTFLPSLMALSLRSNKVTSLISDSSETAPIFQSLLVLDLSENLITSFFFISHLPPLFPNLSSLRISGNPVFATLTNEETYILTLARIGSLNILNYSTIKPGERTNAELYYLGKISKELSASPVDRERDILVNHPRYNELCALYGPLPIRRETDPNDNDNIQENTLAARLIDFTFYRPANAVGYPHITSFFQPTADYLSTEKSIEKSQRIPRSITPYHLKSLVGRMFSLPPAHIKLIWETGEWDPVGRKLGVDDEERWSVPSDDEDDTGDGQGGLVQTTEEVNAEKVSTEREKGKWAQREVELVDGTRQVGFWIEGQTARVRVEVREKTW
ncbi:hypothetical protein MMC30_005638 [Trapelia coarctata]|nr:hypothetical protein [Trapelia coarctata]